MASQRAVNKMAVCVWAVASLLCVCRLGVIDMGDVAPMLAKDAGLNLRSADRKALLP